MSSIMTCFGSPRTSKNAQMVSLNSRVIVRFCSVSLLIISLPFSSKFERHCLTFTLLGVFVLSSPVNRPYKVTCVVLVREVLPPVPIRTGRRKHKRRIIWPKLSSSTSDRITFSVLNPKMVSHEIFGRDRRTTTHLTAYKRRGS